jgi:hypothetical protein
LILTTCHLFNRRFFGLWHTYIGEAMKSVRMLATFGLFLSHVLFGSALASADTIFNVSGNSEGVDRLPGDFTGTLTVNTESGTITGVNIKLPRLSTFVQVLREGSQSGSDWEFLAANPPDTGFLDLTLSTNPTAGSLIGFTGGTIIFGLAQQDFEGTPIFTNFSGSITPALSTPTPAPELSSGALLALGLLAWPLFALGGERAPE